MSAQFLQMSGFINVNLLFKGLCAIMLGRKMCHDLQSECGIDNSTL